MWHRVRWLLSFGGGWWRLVAAGGGAAPAAMRALRRASLASQAP